MKTLNPEKIACSTITFRHLDLRSALRAIGELGFEEIDLGALPGVCDHVPARLDSRGVAEVSDTVAASGLRVRAVNADVGDLNERPDPTADERKREHVELLLDLCVGVSASALVLPNGRQSREAIEDLDRDLGRVAARLVDYAGLARSRGVELWVEAPHWFRVAFDLERAKLLLDRLPSEIGVVCDVSHIIASGATPRQFVELFHERVRHVHVRDASPGYIHHSVGRGDVDFVDLVAVLHEIDYPGVMALELETRDVEDEHRGSEALRAGEYLSTLIANVERSIS